MGGSGSSSYRAGGSRVSLVTGLLIAGSSILIGLGAVFLVEKAWNLVRAGRRRDGNGKVRSP
jgi:hypothetical protein